MAIKKPIINKDLLKCAKSLSDKGDPVTSACAFWVTEKDKVFGFLLNVNSKEDAEALASRLREHADNLDNWKPIDWKALREALGI